jgi:hypothetical protein
MMSAMLFYEMFLFFKKLWGVMLQRTVIFTASFSFIEDYIQQFYISYKFNLFRLCPVDFLSFRDAVPDMTLAWQWSNI